ncbi:protein rep [uncultured Dechloromonas sp.]|uniref:protein rep n=1 Tax=uncultured Dechloromonas sp. TaxID=171719 RepID=UPI0025CF6E21|nr:protein rep [uncultured Dechloromonas sp.]
MTAAPHTSLGTYTKSIHAGRKATPRNDPEWADRRSKQQAGRYALMRTAQGLLWKKGDEWRDQARTCWCCRSMKREAGTVSVYRNEDGSGSSLTGLNRCGNIWTCPVCAAKVAEARRAELNAGLVSHLKAGGGAYLLTLTFPHEADHPIAELLERFTNARQRLQNSRTWKRVMEEAGRLGSVASLEVTISQENGWHPHLHVLIFAQTNGFHEGDPINDQGDLLSPAIIELKHAWVNILLKTGLGDLKKLHHMLDHALNVRGGNQAAEYIAKYGRDERWGQSSEMTRHYTKQGSAGERDGLLHFTPFQLLTWAGNGDEWATRKFIEYSDAIEGKRAVTWSPGLKKSLGVHSDQTDEEIAADDNPMPEQIHVGDIDQEQYQTLFRHNRLPDFVRYVAQSAVTQADLDEYIEAIKTTPATHSGAVVIKGTFSGRYMVQ